MASRDPTPTAPPAGPISSGNASGALGLFDVGVVIGLLVGEGSFGGDGRQPQVTLRMHIRHEALFHWLVARFPGSRLYGPYHHGDRSYYQWMVRGRGLVEHLMPLLDERLTPAIDAYAHARYETMTRRYAPFIARERERIALARDG